MRPGGISGVTTRSPDGSSWTSRSSTYVASGTLEAAIPYYPATYWVVDATCTSTSLPCAAAPDGKRLRRIEIRSTVTSYPSGRTYAQEIQNFANWFQYYRKRKHLLSSAMSSSLAGIKGIRGGSTYFNQDAGAAVTMYDFASDLDSQNGRAALGFIYRNPSYSTTPTGRTLDFIGRQFMRTDAQAPIQFSCQRNAAFILTDGFANGTTPTPPTYTRSTWHGKPPYTTIPVPSLSDIAAAYYTRNPRPDMKTGMLALDPSDASPNADRNTNLHMQTFALTLGALGTIYGTNSAQANDPFTNPPTWPTPQADMPSSIDDLWHATINGRGEMYAADDASQVSRAIRDVVKKMLVAAGSDAGVAVSSVNLQDGANTSYASSYNARNWTGDLVAYPVDLATGSVTMTQDSELWSARDLLEPRTASSRIIASHNGAAGVPFTAAGLGATLLGQLALGGSDGAGVLAWLRGDRTNEGTLYRERDYLLGDIVNAEPVKHDGVVFQPANDGMLHAFDAVTGQELWAYVPYNVLPRLKRLADPLYEHEFFVDGTPTVTRLSNLARTILVGGLRGGGAGYYALDITEPGAASESELAAKVLWEFPNASTPAAVRSQIGASYGSPVVVKTAAGNWVVLLTSGYNNATGRGHLFVLDALTGNVLSTLTTPSGAGLARISAWVTDPSSPEPVVDYVYGGDLSGNLWRFDLRGAIGGWSVGLLVSFGSTKPVTSAPELTWVDSKRMVMVGTGQLLHESDFATTAVQSVYGVIDRGTTVANATTRLFEQTLTQGADGSRTVTSTPIDFSLYDGWRFNLPAGERVSTDPSIAFGALVFTTNRPSALACATESYLYVVSATTGGQVPPSPGIPQTWTAQFLGNTFASRPLPVTLPSGQIVALTHRSDTAVVPTRLPLGSDANLRRLGWKEVFR
jgi:type IV pilus assembly protein PilY1